MNLVFRAVMWFVELDVIPDFFIRRCIRLLLKIRLISMGGTVEQQLERKMAFVRELKCLPVAVQTAAANEQHYEVPTDYFVLVLGPHLKYSSCLYNSSRNTLAEAEHNMLALTCARARLQDGQAILELGCGWGSLTLFMAQAYRNSSITAVSNSNTQREFIMRRARDLGLSNVQVLTADMVDFQAPGSYDRVVSIEMFEHMKNYAELMRRISTWLRPGGALFVHIFCHKTTPYHFEVQDETDWMAKYFFSGGTMPSLDLLLYFQQHLALQDQWYVNGTHYSRTLEAWLVSHDRFRKAIMPLFAKVYGPPAALKWFVYWRLFYMACSELFNYEEGEEWGVGHYLFVKQQAGPSAAVAAAAATAAAGNGVQH